MLNSVQDPPAQSLSKHHVAVFTCSGVLPLRAKQSSVCGTLFPSDTSHLCLAGVADTDVIKSHLCLAGVAGTGVFMHI